MPHTLPTSVDFLRAVDIYIQHAYGGPPPSAVRLRVETLSAMPAGEFYQTASLERDNARAPTKYFLRLGNKTYPHMKLALLKRPGVPWAFAVEEHDQLLTTPSPGSRDYRFFAQMIAHNRELATAIEAAWVAVGLIVCPRLSERLAEVSHF